MQGMGFNDQFNFQTVSNPDMTNTANILPYSDVLVDGAA